MSVAATPPIHFSIFRNMFLTIFVAKKLFRALNPIGTINGLTYTKNGFTVMTPKMNTAMHTIANHAFFKDHAGFAPARHASDDADEWDPLQALMHFQVEAVSPQMIRPADLQRLQQVKDYLRESFLSPELSLQLLCRKFGLNEFKLKRGFKQLFGYTVFSYVQEMKMKTARKFLAEKKMNVNEVADHLGYSSPNHFSAAFKKMYGHSPSKLMAFAEISTTPVN